MRHLPTNSYCGLTIVLSNPSRHDTIRLLSGNAGTFFEYYCLRPTKRECCDIRTSDTRDAGILPNTTCILLLGEAALKNWTVGYNDYTIGEQRGSPLECIYPDVTCICSYQPQDAIDIIGDYESKNNPHLQGQDTDDDDDSKGDTDEKKRHGKTKRKNWSFWLQRDTQKIISVLASGQRPQQVGFEHKVYPSVKEIEQLAATTYNEYIYLDIETIMETEALDVSVLSIAIGNGCIYTIPITRYTFDFSYSRIDMCHLFSALSRLLVNNIPVLHNAMFDLFVLAYRYKIPCGQRIEDTMLMWHAAFPLADKSLGHLLSTLTWEPYHKDEGVFNPKSIDQERQLWSYNAKDVHGTRLVHKKLQAYAKTQPGLQDSMGVSNDAIRPYLINTLYGIRFDNNARLKVLTDNDRYLTQILRLIKLLVGEECWAAVRPKGSKSVLPASSDQCVKYFHDILGYPVAGRSKKTGRPSLNEQNFLKLALKLKDQGIYNPVVDLVLKFRQTAKESSSLKFNHWVQDERNTCSWKIDATETFRHSSTALLS